MREINESKVYMDFFEDINELCKYLKRPRKIGRLNASEERDIDFTGTQSYEEAENLLKYNDNNLYEQILKEKRKINVEKLLGNVIKRKQYKNDIVGFQANVPAYLTGVPLNIVNEYKAKTSQKIVNIFINIRVDGGTSKERVLKIGTIYVIMLDLLEKAGYRVNLYVGSANRIRDDYYMYLALKIKTDKEPLNLKKMCFPIAHASMLRRIKFRWMEVCDCNIDPTRNGYGGPDSLERTTRMMKRALGEDCIVFNYEDTSGNVTEEYVLKLLKQKGIKIEMETKK